MKASLDIRATLQEAMSLHQQGQTERAEKLYQDVLAIMPNEANSWHLLGVLAWQRGDLVTGEKYIRKAIQFNPTASAYYVNLGGVLKQKGDLADAIAQYEKGLKADLKNEMAHKGLTETLHQLGMKQMEDKQLEDAKATYGRVLELEPNSVPTLNNLAMILQHEDDRTSARLFYDRAIQLNPGNLGVLYNRSICYLTEGMLPEGWRDFALSEPHWRYLQDPRKHVPWLSCPLWEGSDVKGKKILVWGDQGIGDEIVYTSMVPDLIERGALVTIECMDRLVPIFKRSFPTATILPRQEPPLPGTDFDFHSPGMWLGRWLRPDLGSFPARNSFLTADPVKTARLRKRYEALGRKRIVGLSWFTLSAAWSLKRSLPLPEMLAPLALDEMLIVDLQYGVTGPAWTEARQQFPALKMVHDDEVDQLVDMDMYAAQIAACDYVYTISNTTSHVAGALGIPSAILMPAHGLTWYWFDKGENCPWYPSLHLLRPELPDRMGIAARAAHGA